MAAGWLRTDPAGDSQYFKARFPALRAGDQVEYRVICRCAGRQVPSPEEAEEFISSFRVADTEFAAAAGDVAATTVPLHGALLPGGLAEPSLADHLAGHVGAESAESTEKEIVEPLIRRVAYPVSGRVLDEKTGMPLRDYTVRLSMPGTEDAGGEAGIDVTGAGGRFVAASTIPQEGAAVEASPALPERSMHLDVLDAEGRKVHEEEIAVQPGTERTVDVTIPAPRKLFNPTLEEFNDSVGMNLSEPFMSALASKLI